MVNSKVKWDGNISKSFDEQQGVRRGGIVSPELYKVFINPLLEFYKANNLYDVRLAVCILVSTTSCEHGFLSIPI
jgi:hypothetical protein